MNVYVYQKSWNVIKKNHVMEIPRESLRYWRNSYSLFLDPRGGDTGSSSLWRCPHTCKEQPLHVGGTLMWEESGYGSFFLELCILGRNSKLEFEFLFINSKCTF